MYIFASVWNIGCLHLVFLSGINLGTCYTWIQVGWQALPSGPGWGQGNEVFPVGGLLDGDKMLVAASGEGFLVTERSPKVKGVSGQATCSKCR